MELISEYLESYEGRDKFLRTLSYAAKLATVFPKSNDTASKFKYFGSQMSGCRVMLRLLDDIPSLHYALTYGSGRQEPDQMIRWLEIIQNVIDVVYSPVETIAWAGSHKLVSIDVDKWDNASTWFWIVSLYLSFMKSVKKYKNLSEYGSLVLKNHPTELRTVNKKRSNEILTCARMLIDLSYAISYLPPGTLWGGKLTTWQVGALGTLSSLIALYQSLSKRIALKKYS
ncbi:peroxisomal membrane protein 11C [Diachasma alloeum]|uniref:peroxisomal membrane protein 11C n=1 Tax=Diachasma alloeum TaxID=454923 RepID=UPI000738437C|nr:peroxisomal membrane protein 11C [Diachasma alloeum]